MSLNQNDVKYNMDSKFTWMVLFVLGFIPCKVTADHGMVISPYRMTWLESFSYCSLASNYSIPYLHNGEYTGWAGGIHLNTQWRMYQGCYSKTGAMNSNGVYKIEKLTPTLCSEKCKIISYFALKYNWCVCLNSLYNMKDVDSSKCTYKCPGSNNDVCGERSYFTIYKHITAEKKRPISDDDQKLECSVVVPWNDTFLLKAVDCFSKHWTTCVASKVTRQMGFRETYQSAISRCSSENLTILSTLDNIDDLEEGNEYWSNIFRSRFLKWITKESFDDVCYEVEGLVNVDCLYLDVKYRKVEYIPLPCKHKKQAICKHPGDPGVIRQCQTRDQPEHSKKSSNKPDPTPATLSTETVFLTSSLATMSTHFVSTTSDNTNPDTPSSQKAMSTKFVSTISDYIDSSKPSISSEHSSVWSRSSTVYVSSSQTSISDTVVGTHMELTTLVAQMDNDSRTVANETTNDGLIYSVIFSVPASVALAVLIITAVLITVVRRRRRRKAHAEGNGNHFELGARQPNTANENRSYEEPWGYLKTINTGIPECQIYDEVKDQDSFERQIYDEATNQYQHLDFDLRSKQPKFLEAEYDSSIAKLPFPKSDINNTSTNSAKNKSARENVAYCDTAIVHTKYLYDTPKQATRHVSKP